MKNLLLILIVLVSPVFLMAQDADVVYYEGRPEIRRDGSRGVELDFGDAVRPGESVVTGRRDFVELDQAGGNIIRVSPDTVFTLREVERDGQRETVMTNTVGAVSYRFGALAGRQQRVSSGTVVAGVRGTEFTVFAGSDGSSLFGVDTGMITVESAGVEVDLVAGDAVQVVAGEAPGEVVRWLGPALDFSDWEQDRIEAFLDDPILGLERIQRRMRDFMDDQDAAYAVWQESTSELQEALKELERLHSEAEQQNEARDFQREVVEPLSRASAIASLNYRYYAVSSFSLRRHVIARMYVNMKTRYLTDLGNPLFQEFLALHGQVLAEFENRVVPQLTVLDI
ncbi:MAG: hypothetical protein EA428_09475 [Spirochaetaceae bacterium]|nr:MAG: hypothetical protein EA428_09475 [Spirochaetaceae bacterium]